jgi:hypothetical protein
LLGVNLYTNNNTVHYFIYENGNYDAITVLLGGKWFWEWELLGG